MKWPTLVHYAWKQSLTDKNGSTIRNDLIAVLPPALLLQQSNKILPSIIESDNLIVLSKIIGNASN
jgi:uncharacterized membrane protein